ncbi:MAG: hypothetical protein ACJAU6_003360, partial [Alphaproteobacteria bacterium]
AVFLIAHSEFRRDVLRIRRAAAIAEQEYFTALGNRLFPAGEHPQEIVAQGLVNLRGDGAMIDQFTIKILSGVKHAIHFVCAGGRF